MRRLVDPKYLSFPLRFDSVQVDPGRHLSTSNRLAHIRQLIRQVLLTNPNERVFRLDFGAGVRRMVFEPNSAALWELAKQRVITNLAEVLRGEVDPNSLDVQVDDRGERGNSGTLYIRIRYRLATVNREDSFVVPIDGGSLG